MSGARTAADAPALPTWGWVLAVGAGIAVAYLGRALLLPLLVGGLGAYMLGPLVLQLQLRGVARANAVALVVLGLAALVAAVLSVAVPTLRDEVQNLIAAAPGHAANIEHSLDAALLEARKTWPGLASMLPEPQPAGWLVAALEAQSHSSAITDQAGTIFLVALLGPMFAFFLLRDGPPAVAGLIANIHPRHVETSVAAWAQADRIVGKYLRGLAVESAIVGVLVSAGLVMLGVPFPWLLGLFAAIVNPVPYIGVLVSLSVTLLVALTSQMGIGSLGAIFALFVAIRLIDDVVIVPLTIGGSVHLHPLAVVVSIVIGEHAMGVLGMVLAVPFVTVCKEVVRLLLEHRRTLLGRARPTFSAADRHISI